MPCGSCSGGCPIGSTVRKLVAVALLLLALAHVVFGVVYLTEDLMGWSAERLLATGLAPEAGQAPGVTPSAPVAYALCLLLGAPLLFGGGLVLFREGGRYLIEAAGALAVFCGGLGLWLTPQWPIYAVGVLIGVSTVLLARGLPHALPLVADTEPMEQADASANEATPPRTREPYDRGDKILVGLIAASLVGLLVAILWKG